MNTKRLFVLLIGFAFFVAVITSCLFIFSIKTVNTEFNVSDEFNETEIQDTLNEFTGKNLLSFKKDKVYSALSKYTNVKIESVEKVFPNILEVKLSERIASYYLEQGDLNYVLDKEGFVLYKLERGDSKVNNLIKITLTDIELKNVVPGSKVSTSFNELFYSAIDISETTLKTEKDGANLTKIKDCVTEINVSCVNNVVKKAVYKTYSGVSIIINKPDEDGINKALKGFTEYHELNIDYYKTYDSIDVTKLDTGEIKVVWTSRNAER